MSFKLSTILESSTCAFEITLLQQNLVSMRIEGHDIGEFGLQPMRCIDAILPNEPAILLVDARQVRGVTMHVSGEWMKWLSSRRDRLAEVHILTVSHFVSVSVAFVRRFAELESTMHIYSDAGAFDAKRASLLR